jgi:hypothetical protein
VYEPAQQRIARWTGSQWEDLGNGGTTGGSGNGTIATVSNVSNFGIFALATTATVVPGITIVSSAANPVCVCAKVTFTATPVFEGFTPVYQWKKNGLIAGGNAITYVDSTLAEGDVITCTLFSSAAYANPPQATSNPVNVSITFTNTWTGTVSSDWKNPANWSCNSVPCDTTQVVINGGVTHDPELPADTITTVDKIEAKSGSRMTIKPNGKLIIKGKKN